MTLFHDALQRRPVVRAVDLLRYTGRTVPVAGFLIAGKVVSTHKGDPMEFVTFEDETNVIECTFFPDAYRRFCHMLDHHRPYLLVGKVEEDYGAHTLMVKHVAQLQNAETRTASSLLSHLPPHRGEHPRGGKAPARLQSWQGTEKAGKAISLKCPALTSQQ